MKAAANRKKFIQSSLSLYPQAFVPLRCHVVPLAQFFQQIVFIALHVAVVEVEV